MRSARDRNAALCGCFQLRIAQITDPHLGSFMSVERLRRVCQRGVASRPDNVLRTGDFLTRESNGDHALLGQTLAPLREGKRPVSDHSRSEIGACVERRPITLAAART